MYSICPSYPFRQDSSIALLLLYENLLLILIMDFKHRFSLEMNLDSRCCKIRMSYAYLNGIIYGIRCKGQIWCFYNSFFVWIVFLHDIWSKLFKKIE